MHMWDGWAKLRPVMKWKWHKGWATNLLGALDQGSGAPGQPVKQTWWRGGSEATAGWRSGSRLVVLSVNPSPFVSECYVLTAQRFWRRFAHLSPENGSFTPGKCRNSSSTSPIRGGELGGWKQPLNKVPMIFFFFKMTSTKMSFCIQ